jgi:hypothetical protein
MPLEEREVVQHRESEILPCKTVSPTRLENVITVPLYCEWNC